MAGGLTVKITQADLQRVLKQHVRRSTAQRLRSAGNQSLARAQLLAGSELQIRDASRRRSPGSPHYAHGFEASYAGFDEFSSSQMVVTLRNSSPNAARIEYGTSAHEIAPVNATRLAWPGTVLPAGMSVWHPGTRAYGVMRRALGGGLREAFPGVGFGNLTFGE